MEAVEQLPPRYEIEYNEVLRIEAPAVTQSTAELPLSYEWEINHKVMSKEKTLEFKGTDYGKFPGRLTIKNNDSYLFMEFEVEVSYPYTGGIYALAEYDGTTVLTYVPNSEKRGVELNALSQFNPNKSFGSQPKALHFLGYYGTELAYVSVGTPNKLFRFDPNTMLLLNEVSPPSEATIDYITSGPNSLEIDVVESSKKLASLKRTETIFNNGLYRSLRDKKPGGGFEVAPRILYLYGDDGYPNSTLYFDNQNGRFILVPQADKTAKVIFADEFKGKQLLDMSLVEHALGAVAVLKDSQTVGYELVWFSPGTYYSSSSKKEGREPEIKSRHNIPSTLSVTEESKLVASKHSNLLYLALENNVYVYAVQSEGNFPTAPTFTCGVGEKIVDMILDKEQKKLYVATNALTGDKPGSIYCFNAEDNKTLIWEKKNITGSIVQLAERIPLK